MCRYVVKNIFIINNKFFTVYVGRQLMSLWVKGSRVHELYTAGCGLYACWLTLRLLTLLSHWVPQGWNFIASKMKSWTLLVRDSTYSHFVSNEVCY